MPVLEELNQKFDIAELEEQLRSVVASQDPIGYMKSNINWEIDKDLDKDDQLTKLTDMMSDTMYLNKSYEAWNPFRKFLLWFNKSKVAKTIKQVLCNITAEIKDLIDEKAELKTILGIALAGVVSAIGIGAINPVVLTILVGLLATMILKGVDSVCSI